MKHTPGPKRPPLDERPPLDRSRPPQAGPPRPFRFPPAQRLEVKEGLELVAAADPDSRLLCLHLLVDAGGEHEETPGLASLTASLVDEGTERHDAQALATRVESLGASLAVDAGWNSASITFLSRPEHLTQGLELLAELTYEASFPQPEVERCQQRRLTELMRRRDSPAVTAELTLLGKLYGEAPYGRSILGNEESVQALGREQLASYYARRYQARAKTLIATGGHDREALIKALRQNWPSQPSGFEAGDTGSFPNPLAPSQPPRRHVVVVDRRQAPQTELRIGQVGLPRQHPDQLLLRLAATLLGGKYTSRLNRNLRERHGFTYGVSASLAGRRGPGPWVVSTAVANAVAGAACAEILGELERVREQPVPAEELAETAPYLIGTFPFTLQGVEDRAGRLEEIALFGLPEDHFDRWLESVAAATPEELGRVVREHLTPATMSIVAVGPASELVPQLERWGAVEVLTAG